MATTLPKIINLKITKRELDVILDATIVRSDNLRDVLLFSVSPLAVKLRIKELDEIIKQLRGIRDENNK